MAVINQLSGVSTSNGMDLIVKNYTGADIPVGTAVKVDTGNVPGTNLPLGVVQTTSDQLCIGFALSTIPAGKTAAIRCGGVAVGIAGAAVTVGVPVMSNSSGQVVAQTAGLYQIGYALSAGTVATDQIMVLIAPAKNA